MYLMFCTLSCLLSGCVETTNNIKFVFVYQHTVFNLASGLAKLFLLPIIRIPWCSKYLSVVPEKLIIISRGKLCPNDGQAGAVQNIKTSHHLKRSLAK